jgi:hypothetical protein
MKKQLFLFLILCVSVAHGMEQGGVKKSIPQEEQKKFKMSPLEKQQLHEAYKVKQALDMLENGHFTNAASFNKYSPKPDPEFNKSVEKNMQPLVDMVDKLKQENPEEAEKVLSAIKKSSNFEHVSQSFERFESDKKKSIIQINTNEQQQYANKTLLKVFMPNVVFEAEERERQKKLDKQIEYQKQLSIKKAQEKAARDAAKAERRAKRTPQPIDDGSHGTWTNVFDHGVVKTTDGFVRVQDEYTPTLISSDKKTTMVVLHGTFGDETKDYYKDDPQSKYQNYRNLKRFGAWIANKMGTPLTMQSFQWSGALSNSKRNNSAVILKNHINEKHGNDNIIIATHSHGGNVASEATHMLHNPAEMLVYFACPVRKDYLLNHPDKFKKLYYFHSNVDMTSKFGRPLEKQNIQNGIGLMASTLPLGVLLTNVDAHTKTMVKTASVFGIAASLGPVAKKWFMDDNIFPVYENKTMIGVRSVIDNKGLGHSQVTNMSAFLPEVMEALDKKYPQHMNNQSVLFEAHCTTNSKSVVVEYDSKNKLA